jgi:hypothetical protein
MASELDASEFVDDDLATARQRAHTTVATPESPTSAPSKEEVENKVGRMQQKLAELKRAQQELERERASLEETRRRQVEFTTGREEMVHHLTRGVGLLEEAEFAARRDAEQMAKALGGLKEALHKIHGIQEETWTKDNLHVELTRASTIIENARMEWNSSRLKFPVLSGATPDPAAPSAPEGAWPDLLKQQNYAEICKLGLALTWPLALVALAIFLVLLLR